MEASLPRMELKDAGAATSKGFLFKAPLKQFKGQGVKNVAVLISSSPLFHPLTSNNVET